MSKTQAQAAKKPDQPKEPEKEVPYSQLVRNALLSKNFLNLLARQTPQGVQLDPFALAWQAINVIETPDERSGEFKLLMCDLPSIRRAVVKAATLGLQFQGQCYLIPYGGTCNFQTSIWGELHIIERTGRLKNVWTDVIYESDPYKIVRGLAPDLQHDITKTFGLPGANVPIGDTKGIIPVSEGGRGRPLGAYAIGKFDDDELRWDVISEAELAVIRSNSKSSNSPAHRDYPDQMRQKSALRRARKKWPVVPLLAKAEELEGDGKLTDDLERDLHAITVEGQSVLSQVPALESAKARPGDDLVNELRNRSGQREADPVPVARTAPAPAQAEPRVQASQPEPQQRHEPDPHGDPEPPEPKQSREPGQEG